MQQWVARKLLRQSSATRTRKYARRRRGAVPHARRPGQLCRRGARGADDGAVLFDFNHPLAGQPVTFEVQLIGDAVMTSRASHPQDGGSGDAGRAARKFCAGVDRRRSRSSSAPCLKFGAPIYVRHEIVHNTYVVNDLKAKGAIFIEDLADVPPGATLVFSAHGVSTGGAARRRRRARLQHLRRHLPAGHQGACRGGQARTKRATSSS